MATIKNDAAGATVHDRCGLIRHNQTMKGRFFYMNNEQETLFERLRRKIGLPAKKASKTAPRNRWGSSQTTGPVYMNRRTINHLEESGGVIKRGGSYVKASTGQRVVQDETVIGFETYDAPEVRATMRKRYAGRPMYFNQFDFDNYFMQGHIVKNGDGYTWAPDGNPIIIDNSAESPYTYLPPEKRVLCQCDRSEDE